MKFTISSLSLYTLCSGVSKVINSKNALVILNNFLFDIVDGQLTIMGSDVENAIAATVDLVSSEGDGRFCVDAKRMVELLKILPDQPLEIEVNDETLEMKITSPDSEYSMVALPGDQYPEYKAEAEDAEPVFFTCQADQLLQGIENTLFAVGTDDFHPQMMGILFDIKEDNITFVATDTRKLVRYINSACAPGVTARCIMPVKPANILKGLLAKGEDVQVMMTSKSATIKAGAYTFNCRFIKGNYPDYNRVIPANNPYVLRVDRVRFLNAVRRVGVFVDAGYGMEKFSISNDRIEITSRDANMLTSGNEKLDCDYQGPDFVIGFGATYLTEICSTLATQEIIINLADPSRPGVFRPSENDDHSDLLMLLMPMNVNS